MSDAQEPTPANPHRGEAMLEVAGKAQLLRPTFEALVLAEEELGPLFALVERAGDGRLKLSEMATLFWFCLDERETVSRIQVGEAVTTRGLAGCATPLRVLLSQILRGSG